MSIERKCENCNNTNCDGFNKLTCAFNDYTYFIPKEKIVRQDERNKIITLLKIDLEDLDLTDYDNSQVLENYAIKDYIEKTIELLVKEQ